MNSERNIIQKLHEDKKFVLISTGDGESGMSPDDINNGICKFYARDRMDAQKQFKDFIRNNGENPRGYTVVEDKPSYTAYRRLKVYKKLSDFHW